MVMRDINNKMLPIDSFSPWASVVAFKYARVIKWTLGYQPAVCVCVFTSLDGGLHCHSSNWYIRVCRHQQLHLCDPGGGERREWAHPAGQPWIGLLSRSSKWLWNGDVIIYWLVYWCAFKQWGRLHSLTANHWPGWITLLKSTTQVKISTSNVFQWSTHYLFKTVVPSCQRELVEVFWGMWTGCIWTSHRAWSNVRPRTHWRDYIQYPIWSGNIFQEGQKVNDDGLEDKGETEVALWMLLGDFSFFSFSYL